MENPQSYFLFRFYHETSEPNLTNEDENCTTLSKSEIKLLFLH